MRASWNAVVRVSIAGLMAIGACYGQGYPSKTIRIITSEAGGGQDFGARIVAQGIAAPLGQSVIVDNRPVRTIGEALAKAPPDGYTLLVTAGNLWIGPLIQKTTYDPVRDIATVTMINRAPNFLVVHPSLPAKSVRELIALAKAKPGELNFSGSGVGSATQLSGELFKAMSGVNMVYIPYSGAGPALIGLLSGQVQLMFATAGAAAPHLKSGRLRVLGVTSTRPSALLPEVPTIASSGVPGYESDVKSGLFVPAATPAAIINRLYQETARYLRTAEAREKFLSAGVEPVGNSPEEFSAIIRSEMTRLGKVIKEAGIKGE